MNLPTLRVANILDAYREGFTEANGLPAALIGYAIGADPWEILELDEYYAREMENDLFQQYSSGFASSVSDKETGNYFITRNNGDAFTMRRPVVRDKLEGIDKNEEESSQSIMIMLNLVSRLSGLPIETLEKFTIGEWREMCNLYMDFIQTAPVTQEVPSAYTKFLSLADTVESSAILVS